ncbi:ACP S-malonyltransferase [Paenibacillus pini]
MEKIAFLFPGQGSHYIGMGQSLFDRFTIAKQTFEEAGDILGYDLASLCFSGSMSDLNQPSRMQPALLTASVAAYRVFMQEIGVTPDFCAGHSLGEYSALTCAGAIRFSDAVRLAEVRGTLAQKYADECDGAMSIIDQVSASQLEAWCNELGKQGSVASVSCYNAELQAAISGSSAGVYAIEDLVLENGGNVTPLMMSAPFHSQWMEPVVAQFRSTLSEIRYQHFKMPVISNVSAKPYRGKDSIAGLLASQLLRPVQWQATLKYLKRMGVTMAIELGPKNVLSALVKLETPATRTYSFDQVADRNELFTMFGSKPEYTKHRLTLLNRMLAAAVSQPNTNENQELFRSGVVEPYQRIEEMAEQTERDGIPPSMEQIEDAFGMLHTILRTKGLSEIEVEDIVYRIKEETSHPYLQIAAMV